MPPASRFPQLLLLLALASRAFTQQPYIETFEVRLHNLDVVVTDAKGNAIRGLTKNDFVILENGQPQAVTNFSTYDATAVTATSASAPSTSTPAIPEPVADTAPPPRRFVFFVDDMGVPARARQKLLREALQFVRSMRDNDVASVVRPTGERLALDFTSDRALVEKKLSEAIESSKVGIGKAGFEELRAYRSGIENAANELERKGAQAEYAMTARNRVAQRLGQLRALIGSMAGTDGRKVLVLMTSGWSAHPGREAYSYEQQTRMGLTASADPMLAGLPDFTGEIDDLARAAASRGVTIYAIEPTIALWAILPQGAAGRPAGSTYGSGHASAAPGLGFEFLSELLTHQGTTLESLTSKTGGKWFRGPANADEVFEQVKSDLSFYYSLAYRANGERDKPRSVVVQVRNHPEYRVRTRSEVMERSTEREMADLVASSLIFPRNVNELGLRVTAGTPTKEGRAMRIPLDLVIPLSKLTFLGTNDGKYVATFELHFIAAGIDRDFATSGKQEQKIELTAEQYANRATTDYRFKTAIDAVAGRVRIALGVRDPISNYSALQNVTVNGK